VSDRIVVIIARAGTRIGEHAVVTEQALKQMAAQATSPHIVYREDSRDLVWDGPMEAYLEYFQHPSAAMEAEQAIKRAMRR
jgi:hypothetical protein